MYLTCIYFKYLINKILNIKIYIIAFFMSAFCVVGYAQTPTDSFPKAACGYENKNRQDQGIAYVAAAVIVGLGGVLTFGSSSRREQALQGSSAEA